MAGILGKIEKVVNVATTVNSIVGKLDSSGLLKGINLNNLTPDSIKSVGSNLQSTIQSQSDSMMNELMGSINVNEIQNMATSITPEELGIEIPDPEQFKAEAMSGLDLDAIQQQAMSELDFDIGSIPEFQGLENITFM